MSDNYTSARKRFDQNIEVGSRVALAPHLDLWMAGVRYGEVIDTSVNENREVMYLVKCDEFNRLWAGPDDLLGALH